MKLATTVLAHVFAMSDWNKLDSSKHSSAPRTWLKNFGDDQVEFRYYTAAAGEDDAISLFGTIQVNFPEGEAPIADRSVRVCLAYAPESVVGTAGPSVNIGSGYDHVMFYLGGWEKTEWTVKFKTNSGFDHKFCVWAGSNLADDTSVWQVLDTYWDKEDRGLYIDVTRKLE